MEELNGGGITASIEGPSAWRHPEIARRLLAPRAPTRARHAGARRCTSTDVPPGTSSFPSPRRGPVAGVRHSPVLAGGVALAVWWRMPLSPCWVSFSRSCCGGGPRLNLMGCGRAPQSGASTRQHCQTIAGRGRSHQPAHQVGDGRPHHGVTHRAPPAARPGWPATPPRRRRWRSA